jgi:ABC-type glycerol-3-phosphate transport system permease component
MEKPSRTVQVAKTVLLTLIVVSMLFPFLYAAAVSLSSYKDVLTGGLIIFPRNPTLAAYEAVLQNGIVTRALLVSTGLAVFGTAAQMIATITLAYGLSRPGVPGSRFVLFLTLGTFLFSPGLIPSYLLIKHLGLINTYPALVLPGLVAAFNLVIMRNFFMNIPQALLDAARIDGAGHWQTLRYVTLPLSKAVIAVISLFYAVGNWNMFFNAMLYLNDSHKWPIQVVLQQYVLQGTPLVTGADFGATQQQPLAPPATIQMAVLMIATIPILIVYPFLQKHFIRGVYMGAVK